MVIMLAAAGLGSCCALLLYAYLRHLQGRRVGRRLRLKSRRDDLALRPLRPAGGETMARVLLRRFSRPLAALRWTGLQRRLDYLGYAAKVSAAEYMLLALFFGVSLALLLFTFLGYWHAAALAIGFVFFSGLPFWWLNERCAAKDEAILRELPYAMDILAACTRAGLSFDAALSKLMENIGAGHLRKELELLTLDLRMGQSRAAALRALGDRVKLPAVRSFVMAIIQGEKMGTAIGDLLEDQAAQTRRTEFHRLERLAQQAPVKLLFPLVIFIFPVVFIILFVPLGLRLLAMFGGG